MRPAPDTAARTAPPVKNAAWVFSQDPVLENLIQSIRVKYPPLYPDGTARVQALLEKLGNPQEKLPYVFHVAGTNGKGSVLAFLQAVFEAAGLGVHKYTSPHLVRFEERIVLNGRDIASADLAALIREVDAAAAGLKISFFEFFTALALLEFSRRRADAVLVETGLGGTNDATNVFEKNATAILTRISFDHMHVLGDGLEDIARHKAGIMRAGCLAVAAPQEPDVMRVFKACGDAYIDWRATPAAGGFDYESPVHACRLPLPALAGAHQIVNAGTAIAALEKSPFAFLLTQDILEKALQRVQWPGRLQRLTAGPLADILPRDAELWLDGAHNDSGAGALAREISGWADGKPLHLITAFKQKKDAAGFYRSLTLPFSSVTALGEEIGSYMVPAHELCDVLKQSGFANARPAENLESVLRGFASLPSPRILVTGSLYLVGHALKSNS